MQKEMIWYCFILYIIFPNNIFSYLLQKENTCIMINKQSIVLVSQEKEK